jgi:transcription initiation factor TFIIF subunit beta
VQLPPSSHGRLETYQVKQLQSMANLGGGTIPSVKVEPSDNPSLAGITTIKRDPDSVAASPSAFTEDDAYEDVGDLDFSQASQSLYLMRIPKFLWDAWADYDDDDEIRLGTVRVEQVGADQQRVCLALLWRAFRCLS